jgi:hypothetical protein
MMVVPTNANQACSDMTKFPSTTTAAVPPTVLENIHC